VSNLNAVAHLVVADDGSYEVRVAMREVSYLFRQLKLVAAV